MRGEQFSPDGGSSFSETEREALKQDLIDVSVLKEMFVREGIKGAAFYCELCNLHHYLNWELIAGTLQEVLDKGHFRAHEPAFDPDPHEYVSWDYACGLLDGFESYRAAQPGDVLVQVILNDGAGNGVATTEQDDHDGGKDSP